MLLEGIFIVGGIGGGCLMVPVLIYLTFSIKHVRNKYSAAPWRAYRCSSASAGASDASSAPSWAEGGLIAGGGPTGGGAPYWCTR